MSRRVEAQDAVERSPLEHDDQYAGGGADRQEVDDDGLQRDDERAQQHDQHEVRDDEYEKQHPPHRVADLILVIELRCGHPPTSTLIPRPGSLAESRRSRSTIDFADADSPSSAGVTASSAARPSADSSGSPTA